MARMADRFAIFTRPGLGTAVLARFVAATAARRSRRATRDRRGCRPYPGETVCGDGWAYADERTGGAPCWWSTARATAHAARPPRSRSTIPRQCRRAICVRLVETLHRALAPTRGAALAVARLDRTERVVRFVGIGNIAGDVADGHCAAWCPITARPGTSRRAIREFTYPFAGEPM